MGLAVGSSSRRFAVAAPRRRNPGCLRPRLGRTVRPSASVYECFPFIWPGFALCADVDFGHLSPSRLVASCRLTFRERASDRSASKLALRAELLRRVRIALCQLDLCFLNHLPPQGIRIRIENRSGIPLKDEPRAQFYF